MNAQNQSYLSQHTDILSLRDLASGTISAYTSYMSQFIDWTESELNSKPLPEITWDDILAFIHFLKDIRHLNPRTINVYIAQLRDFFQYVLHRDWDKYRVPYLHYDEMLPKVPTKEQINAIIDSLDNPKHKAEIALLYSSGIRVSELTRLRCKDVIHSKHTLYITRSKNRSDRYAILSERAYGILVNYIKSLPTMPTKEDWLFSGQKSGQHICTQSVYETFQKQLAALNLQDTGYTLHSLRHAFGLHLYEAGTDILTIKEAMGHKSLSSTTVYLTIGIGNGRSVKSPYDA